MKSTITKPLLLATSLSIGLVACSDTKPDAPASQQAGKEQPVKHMDVAEITSAAEAKKVFDDTTQALKSKQTLDAKELNDIHVITYSLEQSIAYYAKQLSGDQQALAKKIAVVVEEIHIASENNRKDSTQQHLTTYFSLAEQLAASL